MFEVIRAAKASMTPAEFRNEVIGGILFVIGFPILILALFAIIPHA